MRFSFLLRIPITFTTYLVPISSTGRQMSASQLVGDDLSDILSKFFDLLSCAVKNIEEALLGAERRNYF
jgi:undecaprenyl pyrophosphate phosphatase UppP